VRRGQRRNGGFTLLEVLVALSILAVSYGTILQIFGGAARKAALAGEYRRALIIAESQLDFAAANIANSSVGDSVAVVGKFQWQVSYSPAYEYSIGTSPARFQPTVVTVNVSWSDAAGKSRVVTLTTVRLAPGRPS